MAHRSHDVPRTRRRVVAVLSAVASIAVSLAVAASVAPATAQRSEPGPTAQRCADVELRDVPGLRLRPLLDLLARVGVDDPGQVEPPHGAPYRGLYGGFRGDEVYFAATRPGSRLFRDESRVVRTLRVRGVTVRERVSCDRRRDRSLVFVADGVHWSLGGAPRDELETLARRIVAQ